MSPHIPILLSALRFPLAFLFLFQNPLLRLSAVGAAALTDFLDGYLARRWNQITPLGTWLDPVTDKLFFIVGAMILFTEGSLSTGALLSLLAREWALLALSVVLFFRHSLYTYHFRSVWPGKLFTTLQFICLGLIILKKPIPLEALVLLWALAFAFMITLWPKKTIPSAHK